MLYSEWTDQVTQPLVAMYGDQWRVHGAATTLPLNAAIGDLAPFAGQPAAQYDNATYTALFNAGEIDPNAPTVTAPSGKTVYVVAPKLEDVPTTMGAWDRFLNAAFTVENKATDALGLPSADTITNFLKDMGKQILIGAGVTLGVAYLLRRRR